MKKTIIYLGFVVLTGCGKNINTDDVLLGLSVSKKTINADGSSTIDISVTINPKASTDKRNVVITATGGELINGANGKLIVPAALQNKQLVANASWKAPMSPGEITITAKPEATSPNGDYVLIEIITATLVSASSIQLETSSFGIGANFTTTDTLVGSLKSSSNKKVSLGAKVVFEDFLISGFSAGGRFRSLQTSSDAASQVKALYSAANLAIGTNIYIESAILDAAGNKTNIRDTVLLTINQ